MTCKITDLIFSVLISDLHESLSRNTNVNNPKNRVNNVFPDSPTVTSDANNPGTVTLRVIDDKGKQVGSTKTVSPGKDVVLDQIPALSGTYTIQGKASVAGTYTFNVD